MLLSLFRSCVCLLLTLSLTSAAQRSAGPAGTPASQTASVIAVGDVHGDFDDFASLLQKTKLINAQFHWIGGAVTLVQLGDVLDRGPKPRQVMDLLMSLEVEAPKTGGRVLSLLGNHEVMNIMGDLRYVTAENYASFADGHSEERRRSAYRDFESWRSAHAALLPALTASLNAGEEEWMKQHPAGFVEQREAFGPHGKYGKWLRGHAALGKAGSVVFLHGGISPNLASTTLDALNASIRDEINSFDKDKQYLIEEKLVLPFFTLQEMTAVLQAQLRAEMSLKPSEVNAQRQEKMLQFLGFPDWFSVRPDGPLWFRGYDQWSEEQGEAEVPKLLLAYGASHIVVGHTPQGGGHIRARFGGKVFLIDTGMLSSYYPGGKASAMEIRNDAAIAAVYLNEPAVLLQPSGGPPKSSTSVTPGAVSKN